MCVVNSVAVYIYSQCTALLQWCMSIPSNQVLHLFSTDTITPVLKSGCQLSHCPGIEISYFCTRNTSNLNHDHQPHSTRTFQNPFFQAVMVKNNCSLNTVCIEHVSCIFPFNLVTDFCSICQNNDYGNHDVCVFLSK